MSVAAGDRTLVQDYQNLEDAALGSAISHVTSAISPLVSAANTPTQVASLSYAFKAGMAYRISVWARVQINGASSSSGSPYVQIRRASAAGTTIHDPGSMGLAGGTGFVSTGVQSCVVKCSADTMQTISFCAAWSGTGTSLDVEAATAARAYLLIEPIGRASAFPNALEVPTS